MGIMKLFILLLAMVLAAQEPVASGTEAYWHYGYRRHHVVRVHYLYYYRYHRYYYRYHRYYRYHHRYLAQKPSAGAELSTPGRYSYKYGKYINYGGYYRSRHGRRY